MCGIVGFYRLHKEKEISVDLLKRMMGTLHHRGPDESGLYVDNQIGLGQTRLSIIDLSTGSQPIHNEDSTLWIIYNGEVFNYPELRQQLEEQGHRFYTNSDTEVILHAYEQMGPQCLAEFNGQFAFAIWNTKSKELFLARDRVGIRPLYYAQQADSFWFASEIKAIFQSSDISREFDPMGLDQIFTFWSPLKNRTAFRHISQLPPGHYLKVTANGIKTTKYWDLPIYARSEQYDLSPEVISDRIQELLTSAIRLRLRADVPVGGYLSGGLDSSGIISLVFNHLKRPIHTYGIRFENDEFDEGIHQREMVSFLNTKHTEVQATNSLIGEMFSRVLGHCETPLLRTAPVPLYLLSREVQSAGQKVVLTGEGADEVFGGYNIFREAKVRRFWAGQPGSMRRSDLISELYPYLSKNPRLKRSWQDFFGQGLDQYQDPLYSHMIRWTNTAKLKKFFSNDLQAALQDYNSLDQIRQEMPPSYKTWDYFSRSQYLEMSTFLSQYLLSSQGDRVAMAHSVEIRLPYLDPNLMDFMGRIPAKWKIWGIDEKHILKKVLRPWLPSTIVNRNKKPYRAPINQSLFNEQTREHSLDLLSEQALRKAGLFDHTKVPLFVKKLLEKDQVSELDNMALAGIISTQILHRDFVENIPSAKIEFTPKTIIDQRTICMN